jgi:hypothetical protein
MPHFAQCELTAVYAGEFVHIDRRGFAAAPTFEAGGNFQSRDFGEAVAIQIAMPEDAPPGPIHCLPAARTGLPDSV